MKRLCFLVFLLFFETVTSIGNCSENGSSENLMTVEDYYNRSIQLLREDSPDSVSGRALDYWNMAAKLDANYVKDPYRYGQMLFLIGNIDEAIQELTIAIEQRNETDEAYAVRGLAWLYKENLNNALKDFNNSISLNNDNDRAFFGRSCIYAKNNESKKSLIDINRALKLNPKFAKQYKRKLSNIWFNKALAETKNEKYETAFLILENIRTFDPDSLKLYDSALIGNIALNLQHYGYKNKSLSDIIDTIDQITNLKSGSRCIFFSCLSKIYDKFRMKQYSSEALKINLAQKIHDLEKLTKMAPNDLDSCLSSVFKLAFAAWQIHDNPSAEKIKAVKLELNEKKTKGRKELKSFITKIHEDLSNAYTKRALQTQTEKAKLADLKRAVKTDSSNSFPYHVRGYYYLRKGRYDKAFEDFKYAVKLGEDPESIMFAYKEVAEKKRKGNDLEGAIDAYTSALQFKPTLSLYVDRGELWEQKGELMRAMTDYNKAIELAPKSSTGYTKRASVWEKIKDYAKAQADLDAAIKFSEDVYCHKHWDRAEFFMRRGKFRKAINDWNVVIEKEPEYTLALAYAKRAKARAEVGDFNNAFADANEAIRIKPNWSYNYATRGDIWLKKNDKKRALEDYNLAIKKNPKWPKVYICRSKLFEMDGELKKALSDAKKAVELSSKHKELDNKAYLDAVARLEEKMAHAESIPANIDFGDYHALIIGNNEYKYLPRLLTAVNDAHDVADTLKTLYGFKAKLLVNVSRNEIVNALDELRAILSPSDNLLIYYAGHGYHDRETDRGYWLPIDANQDRRANWISNSTITDSLKAIDAKHIIVVADSCYSGTLTRGISVSLKKPGYLERIVEQRSRTVLTSGGMEPVTDSGDGHNSIFGKSFLKALHDNVTLVECTELFAKLRKMVMLDANQTPRYSDIRFAGHEGGDFIFVRKYRR